MFVAEERQPSQPLNDDPEERRPVDCARAALAELLREPLATGLYLVATPIGNLADMTLRAISVLVRADLVYCEDTRHSATLLRHYGITARTRPFHEHNEEREIQHTIAELQLGKRIAIISDAGTPLLSDPGFKLVRAVAETGLPVVAIPGASAALSALIVSGLPTDAFLFAGFLPAKNAARRERLTELSEVPGTLIFFEAPHRLPEALADMAHVLGDRSAVVARELTKLYESVARGTLSSLAEAAGEGTTKGEVVIVVGPARARPISDEEILTRLSQALEILSLKDAAKALADELGVPKSRIYGLGVRAKERGT